MSWIPGWDSVAGAHWWSNIYFAASIGALILLGVFEAVSHRYSERKDELSAIEQQKIQDQHDKDVAAIHLQAANLEKEAAAANERAAAAELKLAEYRKTRREILAEPGHVESFIEKIKPFAGTPFDVGHAGEGMREQWDFLWDLEPLFQKAGWIHVDWIGGTMFKKNNWPGNHWYGLANVINVSIELSPQARDKLLPAATALAEALNGIGIAAAVEATVISGTSANADVLHFLVGEKR